MAKSFNPIPEVRGRTFKRTTVPLTGRSFKDCEFHNCLLTIAGPPIQLDGCSFDRCDWRAIGVAEQVLAGRSGEVLSSIREMLAVFDELLKAPPGIDDRGNIKM